MEGGCCCCLLLSVLLQAKWFGFVQQWKAKATVASRDEAATKASKAGKSVQIVRSRMHQLRTETQRPPPRNCSAAVWNKAKSPSRCGNSHTVIHSTCSGKRQNDAQPEFHPTERKKEKKTFTSTSQY
ncbi:hypothetical protein CAOG_009624 [Capsaspora owczarzaki ATCC 30864]|uniref:Secreted protein n=1 Tax=Capsaspora owczarzaki (strain ATCC 30864) TaxID=595528 RepID=A0A0D2WMG1_CAPO3|nr:hypothetical protein CAOG_009624 [Capsaspora owczarzaki ATCC 30864]